MKNIDEFVKDKAESHQADPSFMMQDFAAIKNVLPTGPGIAPPTPKGTSSWFSLNNILLTIGGAVLLATAIYFINNNNKKTNNQIIAAQSDALMNDSLPPNAIEADTPVVLYEIPKDPSKAPKKWIYRMQIPFDKGEKVSVTQKKYISLDDVQSKGNENQIQSTEQMYSTFKKASEYFKVNPTIEQYVQTKKGNQYFIEANSFVQTNGNPVTEEITLEVNENYQFIDFIAHQLTTNYRSTYIETEGMIYFNAISKKQAVSSIMSKPIQAILKTTHFNKNVQLFHLTDKGWLPNGQFQNAELNNNIKEQHNKNFYLFNIYHLNWINIAQFSTAKNVQTIQVKIENPNDELTSYLIMKNRKICTGIITNDYNMEFKNIPKDETAVLLILNKKQNSVILYCYNINTNNLQTTIQLTEPLSLQQVKAKLEELGSVR